MQKSNITDSDFKLRESVRITENRKTPLESLGQTKDYSTQQSSLIDKEDLAMNSIKKKQSYFLITMSYFSLFVLGWTDNLRGTLFPEIIKKFSLNNKEASWFFIVTSLLCVISSLQSKKLLTKFSAFQIWRVGLIMMSVGSFLIFLVPTFSLLLLACVILGIGFGVLGVMQNLIVTSASSTGTRKKLLSGLHSMYGFSSFLAPLIVTLFSIYSPAWEILFLLASLLGIGVFASSYFFKIKVEPHINKNQLSEIEVPERKNRWSSWLFVISVSSYVALELILSTRLTSYLNEHFGWTLAQSSPFLTYFFIAMLSGRLLFSFFHLPLTTKKTMLLSLVGSMVLILFGLRINPIYLSLSGFFMAPFFPLAMSMITERFPKEIPSMIALCVSFQSIFVILMNFSVGIISDSFGIEGAMMTSFLFGGLSWFLLILL